MTSGVFPPHIKTPRDAFDHLPVWAERFGGLVRDGVTMYERPMGILRVKEFHIDFPNVDTVLTVALSFDTGLNSVFYKFDLRHGDGTLLWREDCHEGHEHEHGGQCHLHIGPQENHRATAPPATLETVAHRVLATHLSID